MKRKTSQKKSRPGYLPMTLIFEYFFLRKQTEARKYVARFHDENSSQQRKKKQEAGINEGKSLAHACEDYEQRSQQSRDFQHCAGNSRQDRSLLQGAGRTVLGARHGQEG